MGPPSPTLRRIGTGVAAKFTSDVIGRLLLFALFVVAARLLTNADLGRYAFALAVGLIVLPLADGGLQLTLLRHLTAESPDGGGRPMGAALAARTVAAVPLGMLGALAAAAAGDGFASGVALAAIVVAQVASGYGELWLQAARARGRLDLEAISGLGSRALLAVSGIAMLVAGGGLAGLAIAYAAASVGGLVIATAVGARFTSVMRPASWRSVGSALREAAPIGAAGVLSLLMFRVDVLLLEWLRGPETVGIYSVAFRFFEASLILPVAVMAAGFPALVRAAADQGRFWRATRRIGAALLVTGFGVAAAGWVVGPGVVRVAFGDGFVASGDLLRLLVLGIPVMYLNSLLTQALVAVGRPWLLAGAMGLALVANVSVDLALIPAQGASGAAIGTVVAELALLVGCVVGLGIVRRGPVAPAGEDAPGDGARDRDDE
ncbi:MAG: oligosaccharide flippase family protein [Chloroflexi bacterium]|nr:oligosaccharide flippase family protein [Chloroflexota bacterium]